MNYRHLFLVSLAAVSLGLLTGCVERKLLIKTEPPGAPAWVDEERVGETPATVEFHHYGGRRIRVGPIRNEKGVVVRRDAERMVHLAAPWYEIFPVGFLTEVIWPFQVTDRRVVEFELETPEDAAAEGEEDARRGLEEAREFREKALEPGAGTR